jgi:hypothetical protein
VTDTTYVDGERYWRERAEALQAEATISYEALERQREATKAAEARVEALRADLAMEEGDRRAFQARALAAEAALAEAVGVVRDIADATTFDPIQWRMWCRSLLAKIGGGT